MVNFMNYKKEADYGDSGEKGVSGREADDRYAPVDVLGKIGAYVAFHGDVVDQSGSTDVAWDRIGVVCYPTRKSFMDMQLRKDFQEKHVHKAAGMEKTFVIGSLPREGMQPGDYRSNKGARGVVSVAALKALDGTTREQLVAALGASRAIAASNGCDHGQWYDVEGTIMGDGRGWDIVCFDAFPDLGSFRAWRAALSSDASAALLLDSGRVDSYCVAVEPQMDRMTLK
jgi:predicted heme/steroid binding protein